MLFCTCRCVVECVYACDVCTEKVTGVVALCALYYSILHRIPLAVMYLFIVSLLIQIICNFFFICNIVLLFHYLIQIICYMSSNVIANFVTFWESWETYLFLVVLLIQFLLVDLRCHGDSTSIKKRGPHTVASTALDVLKLVRSSQVLVMTLLQTLCLYSFCIFWNWDLIHLQFCIS